MKNIDWNNVSELGERPEVGGYAAKIMDVIDVEDKEYLKIEWDFADGKYKGANLKTYQERGFYPYAFIRSYKEKALPFFKAFKTAVEKSNNGYTFKNDPKSLIGKYMGVVLGEEEYISNSGEKKIRLYVSEVRSGQSIRNGDFKVPELKKLPAQSAVESAFVPAEFSASDEDLPF